MVDEKVQILFFETLRIEFFFSFKIGASEDRDLGV